MSCWNIGGECLEIVPEGVYGFIYKITRLSDGKFYIGKKAFTHRKRKTLSKKARRVTKKRISVSYVDSGWKDYYGSSEELKADIIRLGKDKFKREILLFCSTKDELSYYEAYYIINTKAFFEESYNKWISLKCFKSYRINDKDKYRDSTLQVKEQDVSSRAQRNSKTSKPSKKVSKKVKKV